MTIGVQPDAAKGVPVEQISEITGVKDRNTIVKTWHNCLAKGGDTQMITADVIASLLAPAAAKEPLRTTTQADSALNDSVISPPPGATYKRSRTSSMDTQADAMPESPNAVVDLTDDDLHKAITASLENQTVTPSMLGGQITREDQDISRVLEASLADTKSTDGKRTAVWYFDDANPYERHREDSWPVGLRNVGNTCWFNAVIQSLFHVEAFRDLVIRYQTSGALTKDNQIAVFMVELSRLFALMLASDRKYLNPSSAIQILKHSFTSAAAVPAEHTSDDQQDVSEFQHKLLDWLEEAFQLKMTTNTKMNSDDDHQEAAVEGEPMDVDGAAAVAAQQKDDSNPMVKLFYGKVKTLGSNAGEAFTTHTHFGQWPLYVAGYQDIHESLEMGLAQGDIETNNTEQTSNQEQWFTHLPPLLTFELSRFSYNTMQLQAEKLHNKFSFPQTLYLDRYLEVNKEEILEKRSKLSLLKSELSKLEANLYKYTHFGSLGEEGASCYPLSDILGYTLNFATTSTPTENTCSLHSPQSQSVLSRSDHRCTCARPETQDLLPHPKNVSSAELSVLSSCLVRWKAEVETTIAEYEQRIDELKERILQAYEQEHLKQHKYCLHAVMVHEGEAISGHYWSYVCNRQSGLWVKFNDIRVVESSWEEVVRESEGGSGTASAYCLIYIQCAHSTQQSHESGSTGTGSTSIVARPSGEDFPSKDEALANLPADLQMYVAEDNQRLRDEMYNWDMSRTTVSTRAEPVGDSSRVSHVSPMADILPTTTHEYSGSAGAITTSADVEAYSHAQTMLTLVKNKYTEIVNQMGTTVSWNYKLELLIKACFETYYTVSVDPTKVNRLDSRTHLALYLLVVYKSVDHADVRAIIADQIARLDNIGDLPGWMHMRKEAALMSSKFWDKTFDFQTNFIKWHQEYHQFRVVFTLFVEGLTCFNAEMYEDALPYLHDACIRNMELKQMAKTEGDDCNKDLKSLDQNLLTQVRNNCLQKFNEMAFTQFECEDDYITPLKVMLNRVLPILDTLQAEDMSAEDVNFAGFIKDRWVNLLMEEESVDKNRMKSLKEFIGQLFEPAINPAPTVEDVKALIDLKSKYKIAIHQYNPLK